MNPDDEPPSRAAPSSSRQTGAPDRDLESLDWPSSDEGRIPAHRNLPKPDAERIVSLTVRAMLDVAPDLGLTLAAGASGADRVIAHTRIQKSGLALAGHFHGIVPTRIQILGQTEQSFVDALSPAQREDALAGFFGLGLSCVILTGELGRFTDQIRASADVSGTPLIHSRERSSMTITSIHALLDERLAPRRRIHGVLIDVFGVGLLIMGSSGVGKSECALDLVMRGHRLVADDVVECDFRPPGMVFGAPAKLLRHHLEVRGLGILNIKDLFGVTAIRERKRIDVVVRLVDAALGRHGIVDEDVASLEVDRMGIEDRFHTILGVSIPELAIPVRPGRDMASILEVAARNELLKNAGHHAARELFGAIEAQLGNKHADAPAARRSDPRIARARESQFAMPAVRAPRLDESATPPPVAPPTGSRERR